MNNKVYDGMNKGLELIHQGFKIRNDIWQEEILFSWRWWIGFGLVIFCWGSWMIFRKKNSSDRLFYPGLFVMVISIALDAIGLQLKAWNYIYPLIPFFPAYLPFDLALMPVSVMFLIQVKPKMKPFYKAILFAVLTSFFGEPLFKWLGIYEPLSWRYIYSVPVYFVIYLTANWLSKRPNFERLNE
ncbi:CBO0543 family protein [Neobacillus niacini]|uniref:CBO0543 family protein n=1 Tax=Neobacillus niacini TaxID=86668 RepID=UPI0028674890|nr:CBO0543 family protein [Neobacillus niacini]MDR7000676.1 magnesium-transporting ATPase (P-type) [Neobacillus niacini]